MTTTSGDAPSAVSATGTDALRRLILAILVFGIVGTGAELVLLEHTEDAWQWAPLALFGVSIPAAAWLAAAGSGASVRLFQGVMGLFVASGFIGQWLHYKGNVEFELEMYPSRRGLELVWEALGGATPALAPGTMALFGLMGLVVCYKHPALRPASVAGTIQEDL